MVGPEVTAVRFSAPADSDGYRIGETVREATTFRESVTVVGRPTLPLTVGRATRHATAIRGSGTTVVFTYVVAEGMRTATA